jgi:hypothetical protein
MAQALDKAARLAEEAAKKAAEAAAKRPRLNPSFPYKLLPFDARFWLG